MISHYASRDHTESLSDVLYQAAKGKKELESIKKIFSEIQNGYFTTAGKLASEGDRDAVVLLIKCGANPHMAAMGAAIGKQHALAEYLHNRYGAHINYIAKGAVIAGDQEYLKYLQKQYDISLEMLAEGAAIKGDFTYVKKLREDYMAKTNADVTRFLSYVGRGAIISGHHNYVRELLAEDTAIQAKVLHGAESANDIAFSEELTKKYNINVFHLAKCAGFNKQKEYCVKLMDDDKWSTDKQYRDDVATGIYIGCAIGGHDCLITELQLNHVNDKDPFRVLHALMDAGAATGTLGDIFQKLNEEFYFYQVINKTAMQVFFELRSELIGLALENGDFRYAIGLYNHVYFMQNRRQQRILFEFSNGISKNINFSTPSTALHQFSFVDDYAFLTALKEQMTIPVEIRNVIPEAIKINQTMKRFNLGFEQAQTLLNHTKLRKLCLYFPFHGGDAVSSDILILVFSLFSSLPVVNANELYQDISLSLNKSFLEADLMRYQAAHWVYHRKRASDFLKTIKETETRNDFIAKVQHQYNLFSETGKSMVEPTKPKHEQPLTGSVKDEYYNILEKHVRRLT